ncbi:uncharacterized protein LOC129574340 [Sitodiplosis mosellana]|uniref:uncharacterized protein LOC129574340 n=1 Tax=Sitodiplosis mosellana TaxID=263140 RepID=UPI00244429C4|nr:uncharacterized protein LOC129574340 [Sitodiplosis mosellana]
MQHNIQPNKFLNNQFRRPLISTTPASSYSSDSYVYASTTPKSHPITTVSHVTTPVPSLHAAKSISDRKLNVAIPLATLRVTMETSSHASNSNINDQEPALMDDNEQKDEDSTKVMASEESTKVNDDEPNHVESITTNDDNEAAAALDMEEISEKIEETTSVEQRLKRISEELEKYRNVNGNDNNGGGGGASAADNHGPQSFLYLTDLLNTLRPAEKKVIPQIDSDYSNTMHVLGETTSIVNGDDTRKIKTIDLRQTNRALY